MHSFQCVLQQHPAAGHQRAEHTSVLAMGVAGLQSAEVGGALLRSQTAVALGGLAAEAEGLQVAEVVRAAMVSGQDVVHLQGPLVLVCSAAFATAFGTDEHPVFGRVADRCALAAPVPEAAGFCVSKQPTSSPRCIRKALRRWRQSSSSSSRSGSATLAFGQVPASLSSSPPTNP
jgi:hypothetical protein